MRALRSWSVRHARFLETVYRIAEPIMLRLDPVCRRIGYSRLERPVKAVEKIFKGALFDCRMCGQCVLTSTGMACPMNCPKSLRNGPCGGVRADGTCEVEPRMRCVWLLAVEGAGRMRGPGGMAHVQPAVDQRLTGSSSWLRVVRRQSTAAPPQSSCP